MAGSILIDFSHTERCSFLIHQESKKDKNLIPLSREKINGRIIKSVNDLIRAAAAGKCFWFCLECESHS